MIKILEHGCSRNIVMTPRIKCLALSFLTPCASLHLKKNRYLDNGGKGATAGYGPMKGLEISGPGRILWIVWDTIDGMY